MNLLGIYVFSQIVLLILITMILHMGYSYRRDQLVVYRIRKNSLTEAAYEKIFGKKSYNPINKNAYDFLPNFNIIIFIAILLIQVTLFISMVIYFEDRSTEIFDKFNNIEINYRKLSYSLGLPLLVNGFLYVYYFNRYQWTVNRQQTYLPVLETLDFTKAELNLFKYIWPLAIGILIYGNMVYFKIIHIYTIVAFSFIIYSSVFINRTLFITFRKEKRASRNNDTHRFYYKSIQGLTYSAFGLLLIFIAFNMYFNQRNLIEHTSSNNLLAFVISFLLVLRFPNWYLKYKSHNNTKTLHLYHFIRRHYAYYYVMIIYLVIIWYTELKWLDTLVALFFGTYSCIVGRRIFVDARVHLYENKER